MTFDPKEARALVEALRTVKAARVDAEIMDEAADTITAALDEIERLREALTPSGDTKAAYISEVECDCPTETWRHHVPWTSIKAIMAMIRDRAALKGGTPMTETDKKPERCTVCNGRGYIRCDCWPGDCICGWDDEPCEYCCETGIEGGCDYWDDLEDA